MDNMIRLSILTSPSSQTNAAAIGQKAFYQLTIGQFAFCGLYYKHMTIVNDDSSVISRWSSKLIDAARGVIYDHHMFIVQATDLAFP